MRAGMAFALVALTLPQSATASNSDSVAQMLQRLGSEAVVEWRAMAEKLEHSAFDYTIAETNRSGRTPLQRTKRVSGRVAGDCFLFTETIESTDQVSVYGRNDRYEFALGRTGDAPWIVQWQSARRDTDTPVGSAYAYLGGMLQLPWSISATPLEKLVTDPRFSIRAIRQGDSGNVWIDFAVAPTATRPDALQGLTGGSLALNPAHHWAIQRYVAKYANKMSSSIELVYGASGPPELKRVDFMLNISPQTSSKFSVVARNYDWNPAENAEFTLPAYGLPDFREPFSTRRWLVLINIGIVCLLLGLILYRRKQAHLDRL